MSDTPAKDRPRQLTLAVGFVIGGSLFLLLQIFDTVGRLSSVDTRDAVSEWLASPAGEGLGADVSTVLGLMRVGLTVAAVCAAVALAAGGFVLQRHRGARIALSVVAVPLLLTAPLTGGIFGAVVAASIGLMWSGPARDWYAGRPVRETPAWPARRSAGPDDSRGSSGGSTPPSAPGASPALRPEAETPRISTATTSDAPGATPGWGAPRSEAPQVGPGAAPGRPGTAPAPVGVPRPVTVACLLTWVFAGGAAVLYAISVVALLVAPDAVTEALRSSPQWQEATQQAGLSEDLLVPALVASCVVGGGWALGACLLAWFTRRRHDWARILLIVSAGVTFLFALAAFPVGLVVQLAAAVTIGLLFHAETRAWFAHRPTLPPPSSGPPSGPPAPPLDGQQGQPGQQGPPPPQQGGHRGPW